MIRFIQVVAPCLLVLLLTGCDSTKEFLGLRDKEPDAFEVLDRAPLELPPDFSLRPPEPGKKRPQEKSQREIAAAHLTNQIQEKPKETTGHYKSSHGQKLLLMKAGSQERKTDLRNQMRAQEVQDNQDQDSFLKQLVATNAQEAVIDPYKDGAK